MINSKLNEIDHLLEETPLKRDLWLEKGQILASQERFQEAINAYSQGIVCDPFCAKAYLLRGRKYNSLLKYEEAIADFTMATRLDPEERDNWYYYGVAFYMLRDYLRAAAVFERCLEVNIKYLPDELSPTLDWCWMTYNELQDKENAARILSMVDENLPCDPQFFWLEVYKRRLLLYKGVLNPDGFIDTEELEKSDRPAVNYITQAYGLANYLYGIGRVEESNSILLRIKEIDSYHYSFAYVLALRDLKDRGIA